MSSSNSGQWIPRPPPISRQEFRSSGAACKSRGYHAKGTTIVRPSVSSAERLSSVTLTSAASTSRASTLEELIPSLQELLSVLFDKLSNLIDFFARETSTPLKANRIEPELRLAFVSFDVDVRRFGSIRRIKEKAERSDAKDSRHQFMLALARLLSNRGLLASGRRAVPLASRTAISASTRKCWNCAQTTTSGPGG